MLQLGRWQDTNLEETARLYAGIGADAEAPAPTRFIRGVARLLLRCLNRDLEHLAIPVVFVLVPAPPPTAQGAKRVPMLDNGLTPVGGKVWFVNAPVRSGYFVEQTVRDDDDLFRMVTDSLGVGGEPAIVFDPRVSGGELRYYASGLRLPDDCDSWILKEQVTLEEILDAIDRIHHNCFVTPSAGGQLWKKASQWLPQKDAELRIQAQLKAGLLMRFLRCEVRSEQQNIAGRLDLAVLERDPIMASTWVEHAVVELKVLRTFGEGGARVSADSTAEWIREGVVQAASYRSERGSHFAALCCFDMRREPDPDHCFDLVRDEAESTQVALRAWIVFASPKLLRQHNRQRTP